MKKILSGTVAAIALVATPAVAQTNQRHYAGTSSVSIPVVGSTPVDYTITNPQPGLFGVNGGALLGELGVALQVGTRYRAQADAPSDSDTASETVQVEFALKGKVNRDCSFYAGNNTAARTIDFGVIGVRTGNNENVNSAFEMVGPAEANIDTLTAGCNTNNSVEISKNDIRGLVNLNPGGYDTDAFQANIPYEVTASWTGVALNAQTTGTPQTLNVPTNGNASVKQQGAWRSRMDIDIVAPVVNNKGLVAGSYTGTTTLTLRAL